MKLFAIYDPHWGDPVIIPETLRNSEENAWTALASMTPPHSAHVSLGLKHLLSQGYEAHPVRILKGTGFPLTKEGREESRRRQGPTPIEKTIGAGPDEPGIKTIQNHKTKRKTLYRKRKNAP
jgi:hypothetical protein